MNTQNNQSNYAVPEGTGGFKGIPQNDWERVYDEMVSDDPSLGSAGFKVGINTMKNFIRMTLASQRETLAAEIALSLPESKVFEGRAYLDTYEVLKVLNNAAAKIRKT